MKWGILIIVIITTGCSYQSAEFETIDEIQVTENRKYILIESTSIEPTACFLFYPGGLVEPDSYQNPLQELAKYGVKVVILKATADLAIFNIKRAIKVKQEFNDVDNWIIGGHSLGGVVAAKAIKNDPAEFDGLILMAAYPDTKDDLSEWDGAVLSISAENDNLTTNADIDSSKLLLPEAIVISDLEGYPSEITIGKTVFYEINGGNHAQFGDYGIQKKDGTATITKETQHEKIIESIQLFLERNKWIEVKEK